MFDPFFGKDYFWNILKSNTMKKSENAINYFKNGYNCAQSTFTVFASDFGISEDNSLKIACAFGGGMGRQQYTCGAITGVLMALGLKYGKALNDDEQKKKDTYSKTVEFFNEFKKIHGSLNCKELLKGLDLCSEEGHQKIVDLNLFETHCRKYIQDAVEIAERIINK